MLNLIYLLLTLIEEHTIWLYGACLLVILIFVRSYWVAHHQRQNTVFTIEKEIAAHREGRAMSGVGAMLGVAVVITGIKYYVVPTVDVAKMVSPTPTLTIPAPPTTVVVVATQTPTPQTTAQAAPTAAPTATPKPTQDLQPTDTPPPPAPAACADANVCITSPGSGATVSGMVAIMGTANHGQFQFYKVEYAQGEQPGGWNVINDIHHSPVQGGLLEQLNAGALPNGVYWIRLVVVDQTGNFPAPCQVRIVVAN